MAQEIARSALAPFPLPHPVPAATCTPAMLGLPPPVVFGAADAITAAAGAAVLLAGSALWFAGARRVKEFLARSAQE
jgi:hypothetical protein